MGYTIPPQPHTDQAEKRACNAKAKNAILCGLTNSELTKVMHCASAKDVWKELNSIYQGGDKVKQAKLQTYQAKFDSLNMLEKEKIAEYLLSR